MALARDMQAAYEQALRDEIRASTRMLRCYRQNIADDLRRGQTTDAALDMTAWSGEYATIRALLHARAVARHYAGQVTP